MVRSFSAPSRVGPGTSSAARRPFSLPSVSLIASAAILVTILLWAAAPSVFTPYDPFVGDAGQGLLSPGPAHPFGTDLLGRDIFSRVVHGTRTTLAATLVAVALGGCAGALIGLTSAFVGGAVDNAIMRIIDVFLAIPGLLLAMTVVTALGPGTTNVAVAVSIASVPSFARIMRAEVLRAKGQDYIEAARISGTRPVRMVTRHIVPNASSPVLALAALELGSAVIAVASLGFLGYGAPPPQPEWGLAVVEGKDLLATHPWVALLPGLVITAMVLATNRISTFVAEGS